MEVRYGAWRLAVYGGDNVVGDEDRHSECITRPCSVASDRRELRHALRGLRQSHGLARGGWRYGFIIRQRLRELADRRFGKARRLARRRHITLRRHAGVATPR